jgi:hypothetical protein
LKGQGEVKRADEEGVVGEVGGEGFEGEGLKGVGLWHGRGREERRKEQRAKIFGRTNGKRRIF